MPPRSTRTRKQPGHVRGEPLAAINVRLPIGQLADLQKLAATRDTSVSEEVRRAVAEAHDPRVSSIEWESLTGGVTLTVRHVDGWAQTLTVDVDQAQVIADELLAAIAEAHEAEDQS